MISFIFYWAVNIQNGEAVKNTYAAITNSRRNAFISPHIRITTKLIIYNESH